MRFASSSSRFFASFHCRAGILLKGCAAGAITGPRSLERLLSTTCLASRGSRPKASKLILKVKLDIGILGCHEVFLEQIGDDLVLNDHVLMEFHTGVSGKNL